MDTLAGKKCRLSKRSFERTVYRTSITSFSLSVSGVAAVAVSVGAQLLYVRPTV